MNDEIYPPVAGPNDEWRRLASPGVTPTEAEGSRLGHCCLSFAFPQSAPFSACSAVSALKRAACYRSPLTRRGEKQDGGPEMPVAGISSEKVECSPFPVPLFPSPFSPLNPRPVFGDTLSHRPSGRFPRQSRQTGNSTGLNGLHHLPRRAEGWTTRALTSSCVYRRVLSV